VSRVSDVAVGFAKFLWDFVVGDDWVGAAGAAIVFAATGLATNLGVNPWWALPPAVLATLAITVRRAVAAHANEPPSRAARTPP
jgi:hypothetical protein